MTKILNVTTGPANELFPGCKGFVVVAETRKGEVFIHERSDLSLAQCKRLADRVQVAGEIDESRWVFWRTVYGSDAFLAEEADVHFILGGGGRYEDLPDSLRSLA
ncbi:MAG: hypothetical protein AMJ59_12730 [Gammaproteobacteria bacterium SG8_31]|nr:MAG: hypothetical protein AMJ59_12730 [Gammaproteobacteria bacterium SG8_31]